MLYSPASLALCSALAFALSDFAIRLGLRHSTAYTGSMMQALVHLLIFGVLTVWLESERNFLNRGAWWFLASGAADPGFGVICYFIGISRVGVARAASIAGTSPLFSSAVAMVLVGERPNAWVWLGTLAIVLGIGVLTYDPGSEVRRKSGYVYALLGAVFFALAHPLRKVGLDFIPSSVVGMAIAQVGSIIVLLGVVPLLPAGSRFSPNPKGLGYYSLASLGLALALFLVLEALRIGAVSVVIPLVHSFPLFVILIAWLFLREKEQVNLRLLLGASCIVLGAAAITGLGD